MKNKIKITAVLVLLFALAAPFAAIAFSEEIDGKTVAENGTRMTLTGTLVYEKSEWYLDSGNTKYELHLGRFGHDGITTATMKAGSRASVDGLVYLEHIAPVSIVSDSITYKFRDPESTMPLWAGQGERRIAENYDPPGRGFQPQADRY